MGDAFDKTWLYFAQAATPLGERLPGQDALGGAGGGEECLRLDRKQDADVVGVGPSCTRDLKGPLYGRAVTDTVWVTVSSLISMLTLITDPLLPALPGTLRVLAREGPGECKPVQAVRSCGKIEGLRG